MKPVLFGLLLVAAVAGQEPDTPKQAADKVLAAADDSALTQLAKRDEPDPWLVADELCARGKSDLALRFAKAHTRLDTLALTKYIESRKGQPVQTELRAVIDRARESIRAQKHVPAAGALRGKSGTGVAGVMVRLLNGHALRALRRRAPSAKAFEAGAMAARKLGWLEGQADAWHQAAVSSYYGSDFRMAQRCWVERLPLAEKLGQTESAARTRANIGECYNRLGDYRKALEYFEGAVKAAEASGSDDFAAQLHGNLGVIHKRLGNFKLAERHQLKSLELSEKVGFRAGVYRALANLGILYHGQGDVARAREYQDRGLAEAKRLNNKSFVANSLQNLSSIAISDGNNRKALEFQKQALRIREELGQNHAAAGLHRALGISYNNLGEFAESEAHFEKSLAMLAPTGDRGGLANTLNSYGAMLTARGDYDRAADILLRAHKYWVATGDRRGLSNVLGSLGSVYSSLGDYPEALRYMEASRALSVEIGQEAGAAANVLNMGIVHRSLGDHVRARELIEQGLAECRRLGLHAHVARALQALGNVLIALGEHDAALAAFRESIPLFEKDGALPRVAASWLGTGTALAAKEDWKGALVAHARALSIAEKLGEDARIVAILHNRADAQVGLARHDDALASRRRAVQLAHDRGYRELEARSLAGLARLLWVRREYAACMRAAKDAVGLTSSLVAGLGDEQAAQARGNWFDLYKTGLYAAVELGNMQEATFFIERSRAGALMETLGGRDKLAEVTVPGELRKADRAARRAELIAAARYRSAVARGKLKEIRTCKTALTDARAKVSDVVARIQREAKRAAGVVYPETASIEAIQASLGEDDALVEYVVLSDDVLVALVITATKARVVRLADAAATLGLCRALNLGNRAGTRGFLKSTSGTSAGVSALDTLRAKLIDPLELKAKRLLISPHGEIAYLPICALVPDYEVAYVPSGTIHCWLRSQPLVTGELVLAVGDPDYGQRIDPHAITLTRSAGKLTALPATRIEAKTVGDRVLLGHDASETGFLGVLKEQPRWRAVHLACHGLVDPAQPLHSSLALTADEQNDGFLKVLDIFGHNIVADLVVLSACETARGKAYLAEGVVGFTRAFMFAGAPRVIVSLWKVDDEATRALMVEFYKLWNPKDGSKGLPTATALRKAQQYVREHAEHPKWKHPFYWAAWQLWGLPD